MGATVHTSSGATSLAPQSWARVTAKPPQGMRVVLSGAEGRSEGCYTLSPARADRGPFAPVCLLEGEVALPGYHDLSELTLPEESPQFQAYQLNFTTLPEAFDEESSGITFLPPTAISGLPLEPSATRGCRIFATSLGQHWVLELTVITTPLGRAFGEPLHAYSLAVWESTSYANPQLTPQELGSYSLPLEKQSFLLCLIQEALAAFRRQGLTLTFHPATYGMAWSAPPLRGVPTDEVGLAAHRSGARFTQGGLIDGRPYPLIPFSPF